MASGEEYLTTDFADFRGFQKEEIALISNRGWGGFQKAAEDGGEKLATNGTNIQPRMMQILADFGRRGR